MADLEDGLEGEEDGVRDRCGVCVDAIVRVTTALVDG